MISHAALLLVVLVCASTSAAAAAKCATEDDCFRAFVAKYPNALREHAGGDSVLLRRNFADNYQAAVAMAATNPLATFGVSPFMGMSAAQFKRHRLASPSALAGSRGNRRRIDEGQHDVARRPLAPHHPHRDHKIMANNNAIPKSWDWRQHGAVTPIKNQGSCGSCWAFGTTGNIESQWFLTTGQLVSLSEQELVSCNFLGLGCDGDIPQLADLWLEIVHKGRITTEAAYPYVSGNDGEVPPCNGTASLPVGATISGYTDFFHTEKAIAEGCYRHGPVTVMVNASAWQSYSGGILTDCGANVLIDHVVLVVGYDDAHNPPYWIIKNSWGTDFGEDGYIRLEKGTNQCFIDFDPTTTVI